jgi:ribonuclease P protein component
VLAGSIKCPGVDMVWIARRFVVSSNFNEIKENMKELMKRAGLT